MGTVQVVRSIVSDCLEVNKKLKLLASKNEYGKAEITLSSFRKTCLTIRM